MICLTLDLNSPVIFDIETIKISFRRLRQSYANDRRLVNSVQFKDVCSELSAVFFCKVVYSVDGQLP